MSKKISALIAVRKGSKRIRNKNVRRFAGTSLLEIKLRQLMRVPGIDEIVVSTDCKKMFEIATSRGASAYVRDKKFSSDNVPMNHVYEHLAGLATNDHILYAHVTSPLLKDASLEKCINEYQCLPRDCDSLATVKKLQEYMWDDYGPLNYDPGRHPRSQDLPCVYALNFAVNMIPKSLMIRKRNIVGEKFHPVVLDQIESIDVDEEEDFKMAELLYREYNK